MNIPSKIKVALPSIILESNSSNNAIWGQIFGDIANQTDLNELLQNKTKHIFKLSYVTLSNPVIGSNETINISDLQLDTNEAKIGDLIFGMVNSANDTYDYYIFASIATISSSSTVDCDIEYSIKQIDYVHDDDYVHTDNNYTTVDKSKLSGIAAGAEVNVNADWNVTDSTADAYIFNKPQIGDGTIYIEKNSTPIANFKVNQTTDSHVNISLNKNDVGLSQVNNTSDAEKPVSDATQYQLNLVNSSINDINKVIPAGTSESNQLVNQQSVAGQIGDATTTFKLNNTEIASITSNQFTDSEINYVLSKSDVGLSNVDNTSDVNKPISQATQTALNSTNSEIATINSLIPSSTSTTNKLVNDSQANAKIGDATTTFKLNSTTIASITANSFIDSDVNYVINKSDVGLSNVDNTSDVNKPISQATQTALNTINQNVTDLSNDKANKSETYTIYQVDNNFQNLNQKDTTIDINPVDGNYPTTSAIKSYVDSQIVAALGSNIFRGIFTFASNEGLVDSDPAPANALENDTVIDITNNNTFIVNATLTLDIQPDITVGNGYYYDIQHFTFNHDQSGMIKWNTDTMRWDYIVNNNSGADNLTIAINSENNYEIKNGGITASKIDTSFLAQIQNLGVDWNQSDPTAGDYVHNKPTNATQTASGFMSSQDKTKIDGIAAGAEVNVNADWSVTDLTADSYILNKPTDVSAFTNDVGYVSDVSDKVDKTTDLNRVYGTDAQGDQTTYDFASLGGGNVDDVKVNNVSVVSNKIANIDLTTKLDKSASIQDIVYVTSLPSSPVATTLYLIS